jgi:rhamnulokinase
MGAHTLLAFDLGAASGRAILGTLDGRRLAIRELHRFPNAMVRVAGHLHWNIVQLVEEVKQGLRKCAAEGLAPESVAVDTWGVDFGLLDSHGELVGLPYGYRDERTDGAMEQFFERVPRRRIYELTGIQFMQINTLFQLFAMVRDGSPALKIASDLLFMPDLVSYLLTGARKTDFTIATTSQLYNPRRGWEPELFDALGVPLDLMQEVVDPGTPIGNLAEEVCRETGLRRAQVIATASHDTASAVAATPAEGDDWAYISSGTWSLMGIESAEPVINDAALNGNFTNEGGVGGTFRVLKNIMGLWLLQQCRRCWASERLYGYEELVQMGSEAKPFGPLVDPDDRRFLNPPDMAEAIRAFCLDTRQRPPAAPGEFVRTILESLALKYRFVLEQLRSLCPRPLTRIHVIGGGVQNELLCQLTADATGLPVLAGPAEATAIGNLLVQAMALGHLSSPAEIRETVRESFPVKRYEPARGAEWDAAYARFLDIQEAAAPE